MRERIEDVGVGELASRRVRNGRLGDWKRGRDGNNELQRCHICLENYFKF